MAAEVISIQTAIMTSSQRVHEDVPVREDACTTVSGRKTYF